MYVKEPNLEPKHEEASWTNTSLIIRKTKRGVGTKHTPKMPNELENRRNRETKRDDAHKKTGILEPKQAD